MKYFPRIHVIWFALLLVQSCGVLRSKKTTASDATGISTPAARAGNRVTSSAPAVTINTLGLPADSIVEFAETLIGVRYKYGSAVREQGFDCSGFITYVFNHFHIRVPRTSIEFTNAGSDVFLAASKPGDLILFTGTDTTGWKVGHMGIVIKNDNGAIQFIHSASGKSIGVVNSAMNDYFIRRLVKVIRVFQQ